MQSFKSQIRRDFEFIINFHGIVTGENICCGIWDFKMAAPLNDEIQSVSYYNIRHVSLHGYVAPFIFIYIAWFYTWANVYGIQDYYEGGLIALAIIGLVQILTALFCLWSIHVRCALTCSKVRHDTDLQ